MAGADVDTPMFESEKELPSSNTNTSVQALDEDAKRLENSKNYLAFRRLLQTTPSLLFALEHLDLNDSTGGSGSSFGGQNAGGFTGPGAPQDPVVAQGAGDSSSSSSEGEANSSTAHSSASSATSEAPPHQCTELVPIPWEYSAYARTYFNSSEEELDPCTWCGGLEPVSFCEDCGSMFHFECGPPGAVFFED